MKNIFILTLLTVILNMYADDEIKIFDKTPVKVSFETNGYVFFKGFKGPFGKPPEAFLKLIAVKDNKKIMLEKTSSLKGYVKIKNDEEALEFVRLFTGINSHYLFDDVNYIEVFEKNENKNTYVGLIESENYKKLNLFKPVIIKDKNGFIIERCLYNTKREIFHGIEKIGFDGEYTITVKKIIAKDYSLQYPYYE